MQNDLKSPLIGTVHQIRDPIVNIHIILVPGKAGLLIWLWKYKHKLVEPFWVAPIIRSKSAKAWLSWLQSLCIHFITVFLSYCTIFILILNTTYHKTSHPYCGDIFSLNKCCKNADKVYDSSTVHAIDMASLCV